MPTVQNKIGIYFAYWEREWNADYCHYIRKAKRLGFDTLELGAGALTEMRPEELKKIAETAQENGIDLSYCIGLPAAYDVASADETVRQAGIAYMKRLLDCIHVLGGDMIGGIIYGSWPSVTDSYESKMLAREKSVRSMKEISKKAEDLGITCCLEIVNRFEQYLLNTAEEGVAFAEEVGSPYVKLLLDAFHMNIEEDSFSEAIRIAGDKIGHFHIGECNRKTPGRGRMPWPEILGALREIRYTGRIVMEPFIKMGGQVGRDIKIYHDLSGGCGEQEMDAMAQEALLLIRRGGTGRG